MSFLQTPKFGTLTDFVWADEYRANNQGNRTTAFATVFNTNRGDYVFVPEEIVYRGFDEVGSGRQFYIDSFLDREFLDGFLNDSQAVDLNGVIDQGDYALLTNERPTTLYDAYYNVNPLANGYGWSGRGFLLPLDSWTKKLTDNNTQIKQYNIGDKQGPVAFGAIQGMGEIDGKLVYVADASGAESASAYFVHPKDQNTWLDSKGVSGEMQATYWVPGKKRGGIFGSFARFIASVPLLPEIAGVLTGNYQVYATLKGIQAGVYGVNPLKVGLQVGATVFANKFSDFTSVGQAVGIKDVALAKIVGASITNSALSGIIAASTGANVEKSMIQGAVTGGIFSGASQIAETFLGKDLINSIANSTNLKVADVENIFASSLTSGIVAEINDGDFGEAFINNIISSGISQSVANSIWNNFKSDFTGKEDLLAGILTSAKEATKIALNAELENKDVRKALEDALPGILLSSVSVYQKEKDLLDSESSKLKDRELSEEEKKIISQIEEVSGRSFGDGGGQQFAESGTTRIDIAGVGSVLWEGQFFYVDNFLNIWDIETGELMGKTTLENVNALRAEANLPPISEPSISSGGIPTELQTTINNVQVSPGAQTLPIQTVLDLRKASEANITPEVKALLGLETIAGSAGQLGTGFAFIGYDASQKTDVYKLGDKLFTLVNIDGKPVLQDKEKVIFIDLQPTEDNKVNASFSTEIPISESQKTQLEIDALQPAINAATTESVIQEPIIFNGLYLIVDPSGAKYFGSKSSYDLFKQRFEDSQRTPVPEPTPAPTPAPAPAPAPTPAPAPAPTPEPEDISPTPTPPTPALPSTPEVPPIISTPESEAQPVPPPQEGPSQEEIDRQEQERLLAAEEARIREEMARQQAEALAAEQERLEQERLAAEQAAREAADAEERRLAEEEARRIAEEQARIAELERLAAEEAELARLAAEEAERARLQAEEVERQRVAEERRIAEGRQERTTKAQEELTRREQEAYKNELEQFERDLADLEKEIEKSRSDAETALARQQFVTSQRQRLRETGRLTGSLQGQIDREIGSLLDAYESAQQREASAATRKEGIVAPQQPSGEGREITDEDIIRLLGLGEGEAREFGFLGEGDGYPSFGGEGEGEGTGEGVGIGEGEGEGLGEEGEGEGRGEEPPPVTDKPGTLRPQVVFDRRGSPSVTSGIPQRVTGEALAGILGEKEPLFGGDDDMQRAVWNRRSLRLRRALGL